MTYLMYCKQSFC